MQISIILGQFWGLLLVISSALYVARKKETLDTIIDTLNDRGFVLVTGYLALVLGLITLVLHNVWVADWRVLVTIFGWISLIKGVIRLSFSTTPGKISLFFQEHPTVTRSLLVITLLLGAWLLWETF